MIMGESVVKASEGEESRLQCIFNGKTFQPQFFGVLLVRGLN